MDKFRNQNWVTIIFAFIILIFISGNIKANETNTNDQEKNVELIKGETRNYILEAASIDYHYQEGKILARGDVKFDSSELKISSNELLINIKTKTVIASGKPVVLTVPGREEIYGDHLQFNYSNLTGSIYGAKSKIDQLHVKGGVIDIVEGKDYRVRVKDAGFTYCKFAEPHYRIKATTIKIYPGEKIIGKDIQFWWGEQKLFSLPGYVMKYDEEGKLKNTMPTPHVGYDSQEGIMVEMTYPYEISEKSEGEFYLDMNQYGDREIRLDNTSQINPDTVLKSEYINIEDKNEEESDDNDDDDIEELELFRSNLSHKLNQNFTLRTDFNYKNEVEDGDREKEKFVTTGLTYQNKNLTLKSDFGYDFVDEARKEILSLGYKLNHNHKLQLYQDYLDEKIDHRSYALSSRSSPIQWNLYYKDGYDLDYQPYLQLTFPYYHHFQTQFGFGRVSNEGVTVDKGRLDLSYNRNFKIDDDFNLKFNQKIVENFYNWPVSKTYMVATTEIGGDYQVLLNDKVQMGTGLSWEKTFTGGEYILPDDEVDESDLGEILKSRFELTFLTPESELESAWVVRNMNEYNLETDEWEELILEVTRKHDCYGISINYDFADKTLGFSMSF